VNPNYYVLYRGPLSSCNYGCTYCPFAKKNESYRHLEGDRVGLDSFVHWIERQTHASFRLLFTPWGEALIRPWYQEALVRLSWMPHINRAAIQTNLSCRLNWLERCQTDRLAFWSTFHPTESRLHDFCRRVETAFASGASLSVGCVGMKEHLDIIEQLRTKIPPEIYVWVNAYKREASYYTEDEISRMVAIDPHFQVNNTRHPSYGKECAAGETSFTVDGFGQIRRCHFIDQVIGNIADPTWEESLQPRSCPNQTCSCHIGYVHLKQLNLDRIFGKGILERIPLDYS